ncbi:MAG TPA: zf-TFIIB domain-containing protein [Gemmatimonadales bacterium]|nr:zf-TFIIB domain-containing protein [Gemmatimonadales bacterium]
MPHNKRKTEETYFQEREQELLRHSREQMQAQKRTAERATHQHKCPRCGFDLRAEEFHGVEVGRCPNCHGIWLDAEAISKVVAQENRSLLARVFQDVSEAMHERRKTK